MTYSDKIAQAITAANYSEIEAIEAEAWEAEAYALDEEEAYYEEAYRNQLQTFVRLEELSKEDYATLLEHVMETDNIDEEEAMAVIYYEYRHLDIDGIRPNFFNFFSI